MEIFKLLVYAGENYGIGTLSLSATSLAFEKMNGRTNIVGVVKNRCALHAVAARLSGEGQGKFEGCDPKLRASYMVWILLANSLLK